MEMKEAKLNSADLYRSDMRKFIDKYNNYDTETI